MYALVSVYLLFDDGMGLDQEAKDGEGSPGPLQLSKCRVIAG